MLNILDPFFKDHIITQEADNIWYYSKHSTNIYSSRIILVHYKIIVVGDLGDWVLSGITGDRDQQLNWIERVTNQHYENSNIGYFSGKVSSREEVFDFKSTIKYAIQNLEDKYKENGDINLKEKIDRLKEHPEYDAQTSEGIYELLSSLNEGFDSDDLVYNHGSQIKIIWRMLRSFIKKFDRYPNGEYYLSEEMEVSV